MSAALPALCDFPLFADLDRERLRDLVPDRPSRRYEPGQLFFERHEPTREVYFLRTGRILAVYWTEDGREIVFSRMPVGSYFGEISALDDSARSLAVYAQVRCEAFVLSQAEFLTLIENEPVVRMRILKNLTGMVRRLTERNYQTTSFSVEQRVKSYLVALALEAGQFIAGGTIQTVPTHAEIAGSIGANREAVSRAMSQLKRDGVIDSGRQRLRVLEPGALIDEDS